MYKTALRKMESMKNLVIAKRKEREKKEIQGALFTPKINKVTRLDKKDNSFPKKVGDRLYSYVKRNKQKLDVIENSCYDAMISKCTFKPHIEPKLRSIYNTL